MPVRGAILVVDEEPAFRLFVSTVLREAGHEVTAAQSVSEARTILASHRFHLVLADLMMRHVSGIELLKTVRHESPETAVILLAAPGAIETAMEATREGAADYLLKPFANAEELRRVVGRALRERWLEDTVAALRHREAALEEGELAGASPSFRRVLDLARAAAHSPAPVLIAGDRGTGKERIARAIHGWSPRGEGPFVAVDVGALPAAILERELFGHECGASAEANRRGRAELAHGGTLFLKEVGEIPPALQGRLHRLLGAQEFERVGGSRTVRVDVRVIAATTGDLGAAVATWGLREDSSERLSAIPIRVPALRERRDDILPLAEHFLARLGRTLHKRVGGFTPEAQERLRAYRWPGNVRELKHVVERAVVLARGERIGLAELCLLPVPSLTPAEHGELKALEQAAILQALADTGGDRRRAARRLGIGLRTLQYRLRAYGLTGRWGPGWGASRGMPGAP